MVILIKIHNEHASSLEARLKTRKRIEHEIFSNLAKTQEYRIRCQVLTGERFYFVTVFTYFLKAILENNNKNMEND